MKLAKFTKPIVTLAALATIGAGAAVGVAASAQTTPSSATPAQGKFMRHELPDKRGMIGRHGAAGTVTAVSGSTITIAGDNGTTYTIETANAKITKIVEEPVSAIKVGDRIGAQGTLSGTTVTAQHIMAGIPQRPSATTPSQQ